MNLNTTLIVTFISIMLASDITCTSNTSYAVTETTITNASDSARLPHLTPSSSNSTISEDLGKKIRIYVGGFFGFGGAWDSSGALPAVEMAFEHINTRDDILSEYEIEMLWNNSKVM